MHTRPARGEALTAGTASSMGAPACKNYYTARTTTYFVVHHDLSSRCEAGLMAEAAEGGSLGAEVPRLSKPPARGRDFRRSRFLYIAGVGDSLGWGQEVRPSSWQGSSLRAPDMV
jgi:hypothetical protein